MKQVSVIILNWNGANKGLLQHYLPSVVEHTNPELADIIVADNGSVDESVQLLEREFPTVRVIELHENLGFAEGYNQAIAQVETPYVLLLNDDVEVTPGYLEPLVDHLEAHRHTAAVQPKILSDRDRTRFEYAGAAGGFLDQNCFPYCRGRIFDCCEVDEGQYNHTMPVMWVSGACMLVRREQYLRAGGLDKYFFAHMEEIDLCWRLRRMGWRVSCVGHAQVYHLGGGSLAMGNPNKTMLNFRNNLLMMYKNMPRKKRGWAIFKRKMYDGVAALNYLLHGEWKQVQAIWTAHRQFALMREDIYEQQEFMSGRTRSGLFGHAHHHSEEDVNIVLAHYLFKRKKFSDL